MDVIEGLMAVRATAEVNMFDRQGVIAIADRFGFCHTVIWMNDKANRSAYAAWLCGGVAHPKHYESWHTGRRAKKHLAGTGKLFVKR